MTNLKQPGAYDACARVTTPLFPAEEFMLRVTEVANVETLGNRRFAASLAGVDHQEIIVREFDAASLARISREDHALTLTEILLQYWRKDISLLSKKPQASLSLIPSNL